MKSSHDPQSSCSADRRFSALKNFFKKALTKATPVRIIQHNKEIRQTYDGEKYPVR